MDNLKLSNYTLSNKFNTHGTSWLVSDVWRGSRAAPRSGHDVTGPHINLYILGTYMHKPGSSQV